MKLEAWTALDPDYGAAHQGVAVVDRRERRFLRGTGKGVGEMLGGILTNRLPGSPRSLPRGPYGAAWFPESEPEGLPDPAADGSERGDALGSEAVYSLLLTPKGRMVSDLRVLRDRDGTFLLDLPEAGLTGAMEHFRKYLPPRLARVDPPSPELALITILGPEGPPLLAGLLEEAGHLSAIASVEEEGAALLVRLRDGQEGAVIGSGDTTARGLDLVVPAPLRETILARLTAAGAVPMRPPVWATLSLEKGRPVFGVDMDQETLPPEAGIHARAIDDGKGCYTGQEVIVRIRDRGQVNKRLVGLLLGDAPLPERGGEIFHSLREKSAGWVTRAAFSPRFGEGAALAYLRREIGAGETVRVGSPGGPPARVVSLTDQGWALEGSG